MFEIIEMKFVSLFIYVLFIGDVTYGSVAIHCCMSVVDTRAAVDTWGDVMEIPRSYL